MKNEIDFSLLKKVIPYQWRVQSYSKYKPTATCVAYIDARDVENLLDEVLGPENWQDTYKEINGQIFCGIGVRVGEDWVWKWDVGSESSIEKEKGQVSDAFKRAGVKWGAGRFLYSIPVFRVDASEKKADNNYPFVVDKNGQRVYDLTEHINNILAASEKGEEIKEAHKRLKELTNNKKFRLLDEKTLKNFNVFREKGKNDLSLCSDWINTLEEFYKSEAETPPGNREIPIDVDRETMAKEAAKVLEKEIMYKSLEKGGFFDLLRKDKKIKDDKLRIIKATCFCLFGNKPSEWNGKIVEWSSFEKDNKKFTINNVDELEKASAKWIDQIYLKSKEDFINFLNDTKYANMRK